MRPSIWDVLWIAIIGLLIAAPLILVAAPASPRPGTEPHPIALSDLAVAIKHSAVASIEVDGSQGIAIDAVGIAHSFQLGRHADLLHALSQFGVSPEELSAVDYAVRDPPMAAGWWQALATLLPMILLGGMIVIAATASNNANAQLLSLTKHRARRFIATGRPINFSDVAGVDEAEQELQEVVQFLATPERFSVVGARCPHGVLLVGPPGTGKTLLARAVAGEARVPFFNISGSEFVEIVVGVGASRVRDLFEQAERSAPCILFVDEIDAIGRRRGMRTSGADSESEQALNQLLVEMDGFDSNSNVVVIAATNRADILDPALLRPGRFDRQVVVAPPDRAGREAILRVHARGKPLDSTLDLARVARVTAGFSGAELANVMNEGAILAARRGKPAIGMPEVDSAIERLLLGPESRSRVAPPTERARRAHREAGRALAIHFLEHHPRVHKVTIVPHARTSSFTRCVDWDDRSLTTYSELRAQLTAALAGPVAERLAFREAASGDASDIGAATEIAQTMITRYGMSRRLGPVALSLGPPRDFSESTAHVVDAEIRSLIDDGYAHALSILSEHQTTLNRLAAALLDHETLEGEMLEGLFASSSS